MPSASKNFLTGFEKSYGQSASEFARQQNQIENEQRIAEREKQFIDYRQGLKDFENQKQQELLSNLIGGQSTSLGSGSIPTPQSSQLVGSQQSQQAIPKGLTPQEKISNLVGLDPNSRAIYENYLKEQVKPKPIKLGNNYYQPDRFGNIDYNKPIPIPQQKQYSRFENTPKGLVGVTKEGETDIIPNTQWMYVPKVTARIQGEDEKGNKAETVVYDNGRRQTFYSGLKGGKIKSVDDFNKELKKFQSNTVGINKQKISYYNKLGNNSAVDGIARENINNQLYDNEQNLYNNMPDDAKKRIGEFYQYAKKNNINLDDYQTAKSDYNKFINKNFMEEPLGSNPNEKAATVQALNLWGQNKFGYVPDPNKKADETKPKETKQESKTPKVSNENDYNKLPNGSQYIDPQGNMRTKQESKTATNNSDAEKGFNSLPKGSTYIDEQGFRRIKQ